MKRVNKPLQKSWLNFGQAYKYSISDNGRKSTLKSTHKNNRLLFLPPDVDDTGRVLWDLKDPKCYDGDFPSLQSIKFEWIRFLNLDKEALFKRSRSRFKRKIHTLILHLMLLYGFIPRKTLRRLIMVRKSIKHRYHYVAKCLFSIKKCIPDFVEFNNKSVVLLYPSVVDWLFEAYREIYPPKYGSIDHRPFETSILYGNDDSSGSEEYHKLMRLIGDE